MADLIEFNPLPQDHLRAEVEAAIAQAFAAFEKAVQDRPKETQRKADLSAPRAGSLSARLRSRQQQAMYRRALFRALRLRTLRRRAASAVPVSRTEGALSPVPRSLSSFGESSPAPGEGSAGVSLESGGNG